MTAHKQVGTVGPFKSFVTLRIICRWSKASQFTSFHLFPHKHAWIKSQKRNRNDIGMFVACACVRYAMLCYLYALQKQRQNRAHTCQ